MFSKCGAKMQIPKFMRMNVGFLKCSAIHLFLFFQIHILWFALSEVMVIYYTDTPAIVNTFLDNFNIFVLKIM